MQSASCIIGAGYSFAAGLPLTKDLFGSGVVILSRRAEKRFALVSEDYENWRQKYPSRSLEEYLADLYHFKGDFGSPPFSYAVELIAATLATPRGYYNKHINPRYGVRVTQPSYCSAHVAFWSTITSRFQDVIAITTNYDLLVERSLRHRPMTRGYGPGFYYGGINPPQILKGSAMPFSVTNQQKLIELTGKIPLYKLHGSLNWSRTAQGILELYQDMRPAYRHGGNAAIIPPVTHKNAPEWLKPIWEKAKEHLSRSDCWIICGYSLPDYDLAIWEMLSEASVFRLQKIFILDPNSMHLQDIYKQVAPKAEIHTMAGLPEGIVELSRRITSGRLRV